MGGALEASSQRIRYHLRRPISGRGKLLTRNARNTVKKKVPKKWQKLSMRHNDVLSFRPKTLL